MEKANVLVVASREKPIDEKNAYQRILNEYIRLIDVAAYDTDIRHFNFIYNGVTQGPAGLVLEAVNKTQPLLLPRGYVVSREKRKMDLILNGKDSELIWVKDNVNDSNTIFVVDDGHIKPNILIELDKHKQDKFVVKI